MPIELNDLESKRFGITAARLTNPEAPLEEVDQAARAAGVDMLTTRISASDLARVHALEDNGYRLMDTLVYYSRKLEALPPPRPLPERTTWRAATVQDTEAIVTLSRKAFEGYFGHYHSDPRLENAAADEAYAEWAETSAKQVSPDAPVLIVEADAKVAGYLTLRRNAPEEMELVLSAVDPDCHGRGLYGILIAAALPFSAEAGASRIIISTQINNYAVQRVWSRLGFAHTSSLYTFHKWFDR